MDSRVGLAIVFAIAVIGTVPFVLAADGYQISPQDAMSVPERTVDFQDQTYTVDSTIRTSPGEEVTVDVTAPDEVYRVYIYDNEEQIVTSQRGNGSASFDFDLGGYEPGSYVITTYARDSGKYTAVQPLLIEGYSVDLEMSSEMTTDETIEVTVDVTPTAADGEPANVKVVIAENSREEVITATESDGQYVATINGADLETEEYTVYGIAQTDDQAFDRDRKELIGLSDGVTLTVSEPSTPADGGEAGGGGGGGGGGTAPSQSTTTETTTATETSTATQTTTETATSTSTETPPITTTTDRTTTETTTAPVTTTTAASATTQSVLTPDETTITAQTTTTTGPGFGPVVGLVVALCSGFLVSRRR